MIPSNVIFPVSQTPYLAVFFYPWSVLLALLFEILIAVLILKRDKLAWVLGILILGNALSWLAGSFLTALVLPSTHAGPEPKSVGGFLVYLGVFGFAFLVSYGIELGTFLPFLKRLGKPFRPVSGAVFWGNIASYSVIGAAWMLGIK